MGVVSWLVVGLLAGWLGGLVTGRRGQGCITTIAVGVVGAFIGGALANAAGLGGIRELGVRSILVAAVGATLLLLVLNALDGKGRRK